MNNEVYLKNCKMSADECMAWLKKQTMSGKPSMLAGGFSYVSDLTDEHIAHFKSAPYMWRCPVGNIYSGILVDDNYGYLHLVTVSEDVFKYIKDLC